MENESSTCGVCFISYDVDSRIPRVLINCGHTLCSSCLIDILKSPQLQRCPFDNLEFEKAQRCLENYPVNFAVVALLEERNKNLCQTHNEPLIMVCLQDKIKICTDCAVFGEHIGHPMTKIKDLRAKRIKMKKDLEEGLLEFEKYRLEKVQEMNGQKKKFLGEMEGKFKEIKDFFMAKELEWTREAENLFDRYGRNTDSLLLKDEAEKILEEIDQAYEKEENLVALDQDFSSIITRLQPRSLNYEILDLVDHSLRKMNHLDFFLKNQAESLGTFDSRDVRVELEEDEFSNYSIKFMQKSPEDSIEFEQESPKDSVEAEKEPVFYQTLTRLGLNICNERLSIQVKNSESVDLMINLPAYSKKKEISIELSQYHSLFQDTTDLDFLSHILRLLNSYVSLKVAFQLPGLIDQHVFSFLPILFSRIQHLTNLEISFENGNFGEKKITDEPILSFCKGILSKANSLTNLTLKLGSTLITDKSLIALAKSLVMNKLEKFILDASGTKITMEGVNAIFTGVPNGIKWLNLDFSQVKLSDEIISLFKEKVCPKLDLVEDVHIRLEGKDLAEKIPKS